MKREPVISLGAGVQSSTLLLMAAEGKFGTVPKLAIFADTGWEPRAVYEHLDWLEAEVAGRIEIVRVQEMDLRDVALQDHYNPIPLFKAGAIGRRQCTKVAKLYPIRHELREREINQAEMWIGISLDEVARMKPSGLKWIENRWPLVEKRMTRHDCLSWQEKRGNPKPPKSACVFCPYHSASIWREMKENDPESWAQAVAFDAEVRSKRGESVHASEKPLDEVDFSTPEDHGQLVFDAECEGMCGV